MVEQMRETRWNAVPDIPLPSGVYAFAGIADALAVYVPFGANSTDGDAVPLEGLDDDHPLAEAWRWGEHWWEAAEAVAPPKFAALERLQQARTGIEVSPTQRRCAHGRWTYKITVDGATRWEPESGLMRAAVSDDPETWVMSPPAPVGRFAATLTRAKLSGRLSDTLYSFRATRTIFRPYQFKPVLKLLQTGKDRLLIADEVGLGKTIEAGLVWTEMEARRQADRVLVVCPSSLVGKWQQEMDERFGFDLEELDVKGLERFLARHLENRLPRRFQYVTSLERLRTWAGLESLAENPPDLDLVMVDEAHAMRNTGTKSNKMGALLQGWSDAIIFLTATPINLHQSDLYNLLDLLVPEDISDPDDLRQRLLPNSALNATGRLLADPSATARQRIAPLESLPTSRYSSYLKGRPDFIKLKALVGQPALSPAHVVEARRLIADLNTLSTVITRTKKAEVDEQKPVREPLWRPVAWTPEESAFYREFLAWCEARAKAVKMPVHFAQQMPLRLASACLPMARRAVLEWTPDILETDEAGEDLRRDDLSPSRLVEPHRELVEAAMALHPSVDTKFDELLPVIEQMVAERRRALLFTFSRPTLAYLKNRLGARFRVAELHGGVSRDGRRKVMAEFREGLYDVVLANKVASEGLDFEFCSAVINYDLPWNPMEIEQRIGRIDRIGQQEGKMLVASFRNDDTIDERIVARVLQRIGIFEESIGQLEPIVNSQMKVLREAFDFSLTAAEREVKQNQFLTAVEENKAGLKDVADATTALIVGNDVEVSGLADELEKSGRYVGQAELAHLISDWAATDGGARVEVSDDRTIVTIQGNAEMARRVESLASSGRRTRLETDTYAARLKSEIEIHFALDQELARSGAHDLLTANNPLVMAAADVPGNKQARFTHARARRHDATVPTGTYLVVVAHASFQPRGESELWATAVATNGRVDDGPVASALLAALARGDLDEAASPIDDALLPRLAQRGMDALHDRHSREIATLQSEYSAMAELRRRTLDEQHERRLDSIHRRIATALERGSQDRSIKGFQGMERKAISKYEELVHHLDNEPPPAIGLSPLAVCALEVTA
ncbi:DEAD/DEAH box helicase [Demequina maris]|uniref:DEAD/DEAH box helicase n=1 Tax=Demequina maris TaxID=1638982 RepID=UPI00155B0B1B|nr:helicase-related protein [Demequina maris]